MLQKNRETKMKSKCRKPYTDATTSNHMFISEFWINSQIVFGKF